MHIILLLHSFYRLFIHIELYEVLITLESISPHQLRCDIMKYSRIFLYVVLECHVKLLYLLFIGCYAVLYVFTCNLVNTFMLVVILHCA